MISECPLFDVLRGSCRFRVEAIEADGIIIRRLIREMLHVKS